jgi:hypothetical protein
MIYPRTSSQSEIDRQKIPLSTHSTDNFTSIAPNEYFADLINDNTTITTVTTENPDDVKETKTQVTRGPLSKKQTKKLPLLEQIKVFLKDGELVEHFQSFKRWLILPPSSKNPFVQQPHGDALRSSTFDREGSA